MTINKRRFKYPQKKCILFVWCDVLKDSNSQPSADLAGLFTLSCHCDYKVRCIQSTYFVWL